MAQLTTEYLDKAFEKFEAKFEAKMDTKLSNLETKLETSMDVKLAKQTKELKAFTEVQVEKLAVMVQRNVVEPMNLRGFKI